MRAKSNISFLRLGLVTATLGVTAGFVACADALHLDPASTGGNPKTDGGSEGGTTCRSNPECAYPTPVCDTVAQACVECLVISDCLGKPGTVCSTGVCNCPNPDNPAMPLTYCTGATPACVDTTVSADNCGTCGNACFGCKDSKCVNTWVPTPTKDAPDARSHHVAVWTGSKMFVWGGKNAGGNALGTGALYDPATKKWTATTTMGAPSARYDTTAVWDDVTMQVLVWGGRTAVSAFAGDGFAYDPAKDAWTPICTMGSGPGPRADHTMVWANPLPGISGTSAGFIVWGGTKAGGTLANDGAVCDPAQNSWVASITAPSPPGTWPAARAFHTATWDTGTRMIVFGGTTGGGAGALDDTWGYTPMLPPVQWNMLGAEKKRYQHTAVWDAASSQTIVFGGWDGTTYYGDAAALGASSWSGLGAGSANPEGRINHSAVILAKGTAAQLVVFGGEGSGGLLDTGWSLDTAANGTWSALPAPGPSARKNHTAVADGTTMIVWGGETMGGVVTNTGGIYTAP